MRGALGRKLDLHTESLHNVSRAAFGADAAVAVLGHADSSPGGDERGGRGNIEGAAGIAAGSTGVDQRVGQRVAAGAADIDRADGGAVDGKRRGGGADGFGEADYLFDGLALHAQGNEQRRDLRVGAVAGEHVGHYCASFAPRQRVAVIGEAVEGVEDHVYVQMFLPEHIGDFTGTLWRFRKSRKTTLKL